MQKDNYCIIMAGGIGSRFWPMSTSKFPKQFQDILGTGRTMLQQTYDRISQIIPKENIFVITNKKYIELSKEQLPEIPAKNIVGEPLMKNTAACNIYMAAKINNINPNSTLIVLPADHLISKEEAFLEIANRALDIAKENDYLITLGIEPTRPDTGYGYIQYVKDEKTDIEPVKTFTEKPTLEFAKSFLESGDFVWNAGIFVWNSKTIINAFRKHLPEMHEQFCSCHFNTEEEETQIEIIYPKIEKISIDNGILEKADNVYVMPANLGWSDLGTWTSVYENSKKDENENSIGSKKILAYDAKGNIIRLKNRNKKVIIKGLENYIVVDTEEGLLICPKENDQDIKRYLNDLKTV